MTGRFQRALAGLALAVVLAGCGSGGSSDTPPARADDPSEADTEQAGLARGDAKSSAFEPLPRRPVTLYFPSAYGEGLVAEEAEVFETASPVDRAKQIISDLISGPSRDHALPVLPPGTRLRQVYVLDDGTAYVDFTADLTREMDGGSAHELMAVYCIVDSLALNVFEIERVGILIEGHPIRTLNGHMDLSRPLFPDLSLIEQPFDDESETHTDGSRIVRRLPERLERARIEGQ